MVDDPFDGAPGDDEFDSPPDVSAWPSVENLKGMLLLIRPTKFEEHILSVAFSKPGKEVYQDRITADVYTVEGKPIPGFEGITEFLDVYISGERVVKQLVRSIGVRPVLGRLDTYTGEKAGPGNPWGLTPPTPEDKEIARSYLRAHKIAPPKTQQATNPFA